jgi:hypothetical protein
LLLNYDTRKLWIALDSLLPREKDNEDRDKNRLSYGEIKRWHARLRALPAWQKTLAQCAIRPPLRPDEKSKEVALSPCAG